MSHPDEGMIHAWLDGELDAAEAARVEALVKSDPAWAAAAAEARGFIAATSRIVSSLDDVPANVIPKRAPAAPVIAMKPRRSYRGALIGLAVAASLLLVVQLVPPDAAIEAGNTKLSAKADAQPAEPPAATPTAPAVAANERETQEAKRRDGAPAGPLTDVLSRQRVAQDQAQAPSPVQAQSQVGSQLRQQQGAAPQSQIAQGGGQGAGLAQVQGKDVDLKQKEADSLLKKVAESSQKVEAMTTASADERRARANAPASAPARALGDLSAAAKSASAIVTECYRESDGQVVLRVMKRTDTTATLVERLDPQVGAVGSSGARAEFRSNRAAPAPAPTAAATAYRVKADTLFVNTGGTVTRATKISCPRP